MHSGRDAPELQLFSHFENTEPRPHIDHELIKPKNQKRERDGTGMRGSQHPRSLMSTDHQINISLSTSAKSETRRIEIALQQNRQISYSSELALSSAVACTKGQSAPFMHLPASKNLHGYLGFRLYACSSEVGERFTHIFLTVVRFQLPTPLPPLPYS